MLRGRESRNNLITDASVAGLSLDVDIDLYIKREHIEPPNSHRTYFPWAKHVPYLLDGASLSFLRP